MGNAWTVAQVREELAELSDGEALLADGFDVALIGYVEVWALTPDGGRTQVPVALYDLDAAREVCIEQGCAPDEADDHLSFNVLGGYHGERTPAFATIRRAAVGGGVPTTGTGPRLPGTTDGRGAPRCGTPTSAG